MDSCALVMPLCFVGMPNWKVVALFQFEPYGFVAWVWSVVSTSIWWIVEHPILFVVWWFWLSVAFGGLWYEIMSRWGHDRDHKAEMDEEYRELNKRKDDDEK